MHSKTFQLFDNSPVLCLTGRSFTLVDSTLIRVQDAREAGMWLISAGAFIRNVTKITFFGLCSLPMYKHVRIQSFSVSKIDYHTILNNPFISQNITPVVLITIGEFFIDILACGGVKRQSIRGFHLPHSTSVVEAAWNHFFLSEVTPVFWSSKLIFSSVENG